MATAASTQGRPMPTSAFDFNGLLEQQIQVTNGEGKIESKAFWTAIQDAPEIGKKLAGRVQAAIKNYENPKANKSKIGEDLSIFQVEYSSLVALSAYSEEIHATFTEMLPNFDSASAAPLYGRVKCREDAESVKSNLEVFKDGLIRGYLTKGKWSSFLPDYLEQLEKMVPAKKV